MWAWVPSVVATFAFTDDSDDEDPDDDLLPVDDPLPLSRPEFEHIVDVDPDQDPYDPSKPEYVVPAGPQEIEARESQLLQRQASRLEHFLAGDRAGHLAPDVATHYRRVLSDLCCSVEKLRAQVALGSSSASTQDSTVCSDDGERGGPLDVEASPPVGDIVATQPPEAGPGESLLEERPAESELSVGPERLSTWDAVPDTEQIHVSEFAGQGLTSWVARPHDDWAQRPDQKLATSPARLSSNLFLLSQAWQFVY